MKEIILELSLIRLIQNWERVHEAGRVHSWTQTSMALLRNHEPHEGFQIWWQANASCWHRQWGRAVSLLACGGLALCFVSRKKRWRAAASPQGGTFGVWAHVSSRQPWIWRSCLEALMMNTMSVSGCQQWWEAREVAEGSDHLGLPVLNPKG